MPYNASRVQLTSSSMTNTWLSLLQSMPRLSARGCLVFALGLIFLLFHYSFTDEFALGVLKLIPWHDRILLSGAWFGVCSVLMSLMMVALAKIMFSMKRGNQGIVAFELTAMTAQRPSGWKLGPSRRVPMISATLTWVGNDFICAELDKKGNELLSATSRGCVSNPLRRVFFEDFFGLARAFSDEWSTGEEELTVYPAIRRPETILDPIRLLSASDQSNAGGRSEGDRTEYREYVEGEPTRHMLWQVAARTGGQRLYVRIPETAGQMNFRVIFVPGKKDEQAAQFADYLLRDNPWSNNWLFSIAGNNDLLETGAIGVRKSLARSANANLGMVEKVLNPSCHDACVYIASDEIELIEKFANHADPSKTFFMIVSEHQACGVLNELRSRGVDAAHVTMIN